MQKLSLTVTISLLYIALSLFPLNFVLGREAAIEAQEEVHRTIIKHGLAATVGIYCKNKDEDKSYDSFFGTGAVVSSKGHIITSTTVVPKGDYDINIFFSDGKKLKATIVEVVQEDELTVLKVDTEEELAFFSLAPILPTIGEKSYTFSNAHNSIKIAGKCSVSISNISGIYPIKPMGGESVYKGLVIESDAALNPGSDGGPLVNSSGQLCGIMSLGFSNSRWQGVSVPITQIVQHSRVLKEKLFSKEPLIKPLDLNSDIAGGNALVQSAEKIKTAIVSIRVKRQFPLENLPQYHWNDYRDSIPDWQSKSVRERTTIKNNFFQTTNFLIANMQLRRPAVPVTGVLVSPDGYILTSALNLANDPVMISPNNQDAIQVPSTTPYQDLNKFFNINPKNLPKGSNTVRDVVVTLADGRIFKAKTVSWHKPLDVVLLKIEANNLPFVDIEKKKSVPSYGNSVAVLGIPFDRKHAAYTLNTGIISSDRRQNGYGVQIDALMNYGNSGGPVIGSNGEFYGIATKFLHPMMPVMGKLMKANELIRWTMTPNSGVGVVILGTELLNQLPRMKKGGTITNMNRGILGIQIGGRNLEDIFVNQVQIHNVMPGSPAERSGLRKDDKILKLNDEKVHAPGDFRELMRQYKPGDSIQLTIRRKSKHLGLNGMIIHDNTSLQQFLNTLKDNDPVNGHMVNRVEELTLSITLGEEK